jgi:GNAT superfamily N-acetyltransferase
MEIIRIPPDDPRAAQIEAELDAYNAGFGIDPAASETFAFLALDDAGEFAGGLRGWTFAGWAFVSYLVTRERRRGLGRRLMREVEDLARTKGCRGIHLDTLAFQAPGFYEKLGFVRFGEIPDFVDGHPRIYYMKRF